MTETAEAKSDEVLAREALVHSWNWFALHAGQRMQAVNFFLLTVGFLSSGYSLAWNADRPEIAAAIGFIGGLLSLFFWRLEVRTKELVKAGEQAMKVSEEILARASGADALRIAEIVETPKQPFSSYGWVIPGIQATVFVGFVAGGIYALVAVIP